MLPITLHGRGTNKIQTDASIYFEGMIETEFSLASRMSLEVSISTHVYKSG